MVKKLISPKVKELYADILCQAFSPCGNVLVAGSIYGNLHVFDLRTALNPPEDDVESVLKPWMTFSLALDKAACSMASTDKFLLVGSVGKVFGFDWKAIVAGKSPRVAWCWDLPNAKEQLESVEANALVVGGAGLAYVGCGDNKIHVYSLEDGRLVRTLSGHQGYVHDLCNMDSDGMASVSEDGTVRLWDLRSHAVRGVLEPSKMTELERPSLGKWVGAVHVDKEWLVCGGGVRTGLWHIPTLQLTTTFQTEDCPIHAVKLNEERVMIGGEKKLEQFNLTGEPLSSIGCSSNTILSLAYAETPRRLLCVSGTSQFLDVCTTLDNRDQVLACC